MVDEWLRIVMVIKEKNHPNDILTTCICVIGSLSLFTFPLPRIKSLQLRKKSLRSN